MEMPGVEMHAHRLASLLALADGRPLGIQAAPSALNATLLLFAITAGLVIGERIPNLRHSLTQAVGMVVLAGAAGTGLLLGGLWLDGALPLAAFGLVSLAAWTRRGADQQRKRQEVQDLLTESTLQTQQLKKHNQVVRQLFGRFVSHDIAEELLTKTSHLKQESELKEVTILMADLRGFSLVSQHYQPADVVRLLNIYLESMIEVVNHHGGTVDEVLGDAILVFFGAPLARQNHREDAITCALAMQIAMEKVNATITSLGLPSVEMGIGICSGEVMVGTIGSSVRAKYGVVGTAVNMAARIEELTVGGEILAAESTILGISKQLHIEAEQQLQAKGKADPLRVFSITGIGGHHGLELPRTEARDVELKEPLNICFWLMNGKHRDQQTHQAQVTHVNDRGARLILQQNNLDLMTNLALRLPGIEEDIYAKVRSKAINIVDIQYTYVPTVAKALLASLIRKEND